MTVPIRQAMKVGAYIMKQKFMGVKKYPLVLMLEPLFRCNLACVGCGKIQFPEHILKRYLSLEDCLSAAEECGAPVVTIAGGEPLIHPDIVEIAEGICKQKRFVYLCTNALLLSRDYKKFKPNPYFTFSVHLDGMEEKHDDIVDRKGTFKKAVSAIRDVKEAGFRVTVNCTLFDGENPEEVRDMLDFVTHELGVDGITISPGYSYEKAPDQEHFLKRENTRELFRAILKDQKKKGWQFNQSPQFLDFLKGDIEYECTPWGNPCRNIFGWQRPCYLMADGGYARSFKELMEETDWEQYGTGRHEKCADCMVHCGYEPTAVIDATTNPKQMWRAAKSALVG